MRGGENMEDIKVEEIQKKVSELLPSFVIKALTDSYDSPLKKAVEESLKSQGGAIKQFIDKQLATLFQSKEFGQEVQKLLIAELLKRGFSR